MVDINVGLGVVDNPRRFIWFIIYQSPLYLCTSVFNFLFYFFAFYSPPYREGPGAGLFLMVSFMNLFPFSVHTR